MKARIWVRIVVLSLLVALTVGLWRTFRTGVDGARLAAEIRAESEAVQARLDDRFDRLERKMDGLEARLDQRLDRLEDKLDRLIKLATPRLPDGMEFAP